MDLAIKNSKLGTVYIDQGGISWNQEDPKKQIILFKVPVAPYIFFIRGIQIVKPVPGVQIVERSTLCTPGTGYLYPVHLR